jgi:hypothetical protein
LFDEPLQEVCGFGPERAGPFFLAFPAEQHTARSRQAEIDSLQTNDFADAGAGVKHQTQEREVSTVIPVVNFRRFQHRLDFIKVEMFNLAGASALERNAENALGLLQVFALST